MGSDSPWLSEWGDTKITDDELPPYRPQALLLIQGTGGGKSAVAQTVGCVNCGVTVVIEPTIALSADQRSKVARDRNTYGPVLAYQLDSVKNPLLVDKLKKNWKN